MGELPQDSTHPLLSGVLDTLDEELVLFQLAGQAIHANRAVADRLTGEDGDRLFAKMRELVQAMADRVNAESGSRHIEPLARDVWTASGQIRLQACYLGRIPPRSDSAVVVRCQDAPAKSKLTFLQHHYHLTRQEARVAVLLAKRNTNKEIARKLGISSHTARHHTEHVLMKLGVHSRRDVQAFLLSS